MSQAKSTNKTKISKHKTTKAAIFHKHKNVQDSISCLICVLVLFVRCLHKKNKAEPKLF